MASDRLFEMLAQAKGQPSKALRAVESAGQAGNDILGGYAQGLGIRRQMAEYPLEVAGKKAGLYTSFGNLAKEVGPDRAAEIMGPVFKGVGLDMPTQQTIPGQEPTPDQLIGQGEFGKNRLEAMKTAEGISNEAPYEPAQVRAILSQNPSIAEALIQANPSGKIPNRQVQAAISAIRPNIMSGMVNLRGANAILGALPSHQGAGTPGGAASGVQLSARQGKALIANPSSSPQQIGLATGDLARTVLRAAPQLDAIRGADFSNTLAGQLNGFAQRFTSGDIAPKDIPAVRKQMYDLFTDLENSSHPMIARELSQIENIYGPQGMLPPNWEKIKASEMGTDISDIPFNAGVGSAQNPNISTGIPQGKVRVSNGKKSFYIDPNDVPNAKQDGFTPQ